MQIDRKIRFREDGTLKILQISDAQDMHIVRPEMVRMLNRIYDTEKPDLIVFTGDNILGNHVDDMVVGTWHPRRSKAFTTRRIRQSLCHILEPIELRGIPFTMTYGNHDDRNALTKREQADMWAKYEYFFGLNEDPSVPCDTFNVPIYDRTGARIVYNLWLMDSAGERADGSDYACVQPESLNWYRKTSAALRAQNGGEPVHSLMFQHIPMPEMGALFIPCAAGDAGAIRKRDGSYCRLDPDHATGFGYEYNDFLPADCGQLAVLLETGDVDAVVSGHLHLNGFDGVAHGMRMIATPGASFRSYGLPQTRGVRVFNFREDDPSGFETHTITYFELFGENLSTKTRYFFNGDEMEGKKNALLGAAAGTAAVTAAAIAAALLLKKKE
ncbi:MAG: metallophosphoesterase [Clostridia bacterium]|nr:metallophosphoesterase [Clostridia bacterium]